MNNSPDKAYYRPDEIAAEFAVSLRNVYHWISIGIIQHVHCGKRIRVPEQEVERIRKDGIRPCTVPVAHH